MTRGYIRGKNSNSMSIAVNFTTLELVLLPVYREKGNNESIKFDHKNGVRSVAGVKILAANTFNQILSFSKKNQSCYWFC